MNLSFISSSSRAEPAPAPRFPYGNDNYEMLYWFALTGIGFVIEDELSDIINSASDSEIPDKLRLIRASLGFSTKDLAAILRVSRPTIYKWLRGEGKEIEPDNRNRIDLLHRLVTSAKDLTADWNVLFLETPGRKQEWLDRLSAEHLDPARLASSMREMDREANDLVASRREALGITHDPTRTPAQQEAALRSIPKP